MKYTVEEKLARNVKVGDEIWLCGKEFKKVTAIDKGLPHHNVILLTCGDVTYQEVKHQILLVKCPVLSAEKAFEEAMQEYLDNKSFIAMLVS